MGIGINIPTTSTARRARRKYPWTALVFTAPAASAVAVMATDVDLFGNPVEESSVDQQTGPIPTNDMDQVESVLRAAIQEGFTLVGPSERVYLRIGKESLEDVSSSVDALVHQLINAGWLDVGGTHYFSYGRFSGSGRSVLVPRRTKNAASRWRSLHRPQSWNKDRKRRSA